MKRVIIGIIAVAVVAVAVTAGIGIYRRANAKPIDSELTGLRNAEEAEPPGGLMSNSLIARLETLEEAEQVAELYGIVLVNYENKVATYVTDKEPQELIRWGKEQSYPTLSVNNTFTTQ